MDNADDSQTIQKLRDRLRIFVQERDWASFHSPKNLASALGVESAELLEIFLWKNDEQSRSLSTKELERAKMEIGDIMICLVRLADELSIDPVAAAFEKVGINAQKYPADLVRGDSRKYSDY